MLSSVSPLRYSCPILYLSGVHFLYFRDDHAILKWNLVTKETVKVASMPNELYPTDLHWFPRGQVAGKKQGQDLLLVTAADGM
jgi:intraflagellar transport protein 80